MTSPDIAVLVLADWHGAGLQVWRGGVFDSAREAQERWDEFCRDVSPDAKLDRFIYIDSSTGRAL